MSELGVAQLDADGTATFRTSDLPMGRHTVLASYEGDDRHDGSHGQTAQRVLRALTDPYHIAVVEDGAVGFWPLDETEGTVAHDLVAGWDGEYVGADVLLGQPGPYGHPAIRAGGSTYAADTGVRIPHKDELYPIPAGTLEVWAWWAAQGIGILYGSQGAGPIMGAPISWNLRHSATTIGGGAVPLNADQVTLGDGTGISTARRATGTAWPSQTWVHAVATYSGGDPANIRIYRNAVDVSSDPVRLDGSAVLARANVPLWWGASQVTQNPFYWSGYLALPAIYDYPLSPSQVVEHYQLLAS